MKAAGTHIYHNHYTNTLKYLFEELEKNVEIVEKHQTNNVHCFQFSKLEMNP